MRYPAAETAEKHARILSEASALFREHGFAATMSKPFTLHELRVTLETVITSPTCRVH